MVTSTLIVRNADERFKVGAVRFSPGLKFLLRFIPLVSVCLTLGAALKFAGLKTNAGRITIGVLGGGVVWYILTAKLQKWVWSRKFLTDILNESDWILGDKAGYIVGGANTAIRPRHLFAAIEFVIALLAYVIIWILSISAPHDIIPTLALILLLIMLLCFGLAGLTFYVDRYRIPVLLLFVLFAWIPGLFRQSDHFYRAVPRSKAAPSNLGSTLILPHFNGEVPVLVAATGGGIQASAWAARVLTVSP